MTRCPKCDGGNIIKIAFRDYYATLAVPYIQRKRMLPKHSAVYAYACAKCGHIFDLTLENPEKLAPFAGQNN